MRVMTRGTRSPRVIARCGAAQARRAAAHAVPRRSVPHLLGRIRVGRLGLDVRLADELAYLKGAPFQGDLLGPVNVKPPARVEASTGETLNVPFRTSSHVLREFQ